MKPAPFEYHSPTTTTDAVALLAELGDEAKPLAGGQSLIPMLALRLAVFEHLVDLGRIDELRGIELRGSAGNEPGETWIGAGTTQTQIERSAELATALPLLVRAAALIGHFQIRNRGSIGGSLAHADAAAEYPAVALALDAQFDVLSPSGSRTIPAGEFFTGMWSTALDDDELLTGVRFPAWQGRTGFAIEEFARRHGDFAIAGAALAVELGDGGAVRRCGIGLLGLGSAPARATDAEAAIVGAAVHDVDPNEVGALAMAGLDSVPGDLHGSSDYRRHVGAAMVAKAWRSAVEEAQRAGGGTA